MIEEIRQEATRRGITRLCHFTPVRKFLHIAADRAGIVSSAELQESEKEVFDPTDRERLDGHPGHVCCSIEYPNVYYFRKAALAEVIYPDWVVLFTKPHYLWQEGTLFCPRNAAAAYGRYIAPGYAAFASLFARSVPSDRVPVRRATRLAACPTDIQAEVLVPGRIAYDDIIGVAVASEEAAARALSQLRLCGAAPTAIPFAIAPELFTQTTLRDLLSAGIKPKEHVWRP